MSIGSFPIFPLSEYFDRTSSHFAPSAPVLPTVRAPLISNRKSMSGSGASGDVTLVSAIQEHVNVRPSFSAHLSSCVSWSAMKAANSAIARYIIRLVALPLLFGLQVLHFLHQRLPRLVLQVELLVHEDDLAVLADEDERPHHVLEAVRLVNLLVRIGDEVERELEFLAELLVRADAVHRDADDGRLGLLELLGA